MLNLIFKMLSITFAKFFKRKSYKNLVIMI